MALKCPPHGAAADDERRTHALGNFDRVLRTQRFGGDFERWQVAQARQHGQRIGAQPRVIRLHREALERRQQLVLRGTRVLGQVGYDRAAFGVTAAFEDPAQRCGIERGVDRQQHQEQGGAHFGVAVGLFFVEAVQRRQLQALFVPVHAAQQRQHDVALPLQARLQEAREQLVHDGRGVVGRQRAECERRRDAGGLGARRWIAEQIPEHAGQAGARVQAKGQDAAQLGRFVAVLRYREQRRLELRVPARRDDERRFPSHHGIGMLQLVRRILGDEAGNGLSIRLRVRGTAHQHGRQQARPASGCAQAVCGSCMGTGVGEHGRVATSGHNHWEKAVVWQKAAYLARLRSWG